MTPKLPEITREILEQYLHDALSTTEAALVEKLLREQPNMNLLLNQIRSEGEFEEHTVSSIWRRSRLSCPSSEELLLYLEDVLPTEQSEFIRGHMQLSGCHMCVATLDHLRSLQEEPDESSKQKQRQTKILDSLRASQPGER